MKVLLLSLTLPAEGDKKAITFKQVGGGLVVTQIMIEDGELLGYMNNTMGQGLAEAARYYQDLDVAYPVCQR